MLKQVMTNVIKKNLCCNKTCLSFHYYFLILTSIGRKTENSQIQATYKADHEFIQRSHGTLICTWNELAKH